MMQKLNKNDFNEVRQWIYRNARHIELTLWQYEFENGSQEAVLNALSFYQNEDGGFGNTLEPDSWNPDSTPYTTSIAISMLKMIDFTDIKHPIVSGILRFLDSGAYFTENGWLWSIPTNNDYPHAPWWNYESDDATTEFGLSAELACFIFSVCKKDSALYKKASTVVQNIINRLRQSIECDAVGGNVSGICMLVETLEKLDLLDTFDAAFLLEAAKKMVANAIVTDSSKWIQYGGYPHEYVQDPDSVYYSDYKDAVQQELDYLIKTRPSQAVWGITWTWFDNMEKYEKAFTISENWWRSFHAIWKIRFLKSFDRLETM